MRPVGLAKLALVIGLVSVVVGCTPLWNSRNVPPPLLKSEAAFQPLSAPSDNSCSSPILEPDRSALLQEALKVEKLLRKLRETSKFQHFEERLRQRGKRLGQVRVLFDETNNVAILGIANEGNAEKVAHQVRIKLKAGKEDEPADGAEPAIQATACGQATGEAVPAGAKMQPLSLPPEGGGFEGGYEGPQICTSQWGYDYLCLSRTPMLSISLTGVSPSLSLPQTFITQPTQASLVVWNYGGGTLTGTVSVPAPFSIVSGASFSLLPGQPQEVVVRFSSATAGSFSRSISISSNGGSQTVTATSIAHKVSFSPAQLDFGSGLLVLREQCNDMGVCGLRTEKVGLPVEKTLTVKNEGSVSVTLTLSTTAPYSIVSVLPSLSPGQSGQVTLRFDPSESGNFTGNVQVGIQDGQGSVSYSPLVGVAHKIEIEPAVLNFRLIFTGRAGTLPFTVKNQGVTSVVLTASTDSPFSIIGGNSFTLASSESRPMTIQFSPTGSGDFTGSLRLSVGAVTTVVPIAATSRTVAEFLQMLSNLNDPMSSVGDYYSTLYVENASYQLDMILAGFAQLTEADLNNWLNFAPNLGGSGTVPDPQRVEALSVLESIGAEIAGWLSQLAQAVQENRFDEVYDSLLTQGFSQIEQAFMVLLGTSNPSDARNFFLGLVQTQPDQTGQNDWRSALRALIAVFLGAGVDAWMQKLDNALLQWTFLLPGLCDGAACVNPLPDPEQNAYRQLHRLFSKITSGMGLTDSQIREVIDRFGAFFQWASEVRVAREVSFGTLQVAINAGVAGWIVLGPVNGQGGLLGKGNENAFLIVRGPKEVTGAESNILAIVRGDACATCNTPTNTRDILDWLAEAAEFVKNTKPENVGGRMDDQRVVVLAFTKSSTDVETLINNLLKDPYFRQSADNIRNITGMPVIFFYRQSGQLYYTCSHNCEMLNGQQVPVKIIMALACMVRPSSCGTMPIRKP